MPNALSTLAVVLLFLVRPAVCQERRSFSERFRYGGEVTGNISPVDHGYFNELEYERNLLRLVRVNFALEFRASDKVAILTEIRSDNFDVPEPYALYVRLRPWRDHAFDIQVGRIPPVFGAFARRRYDIGNPLIGYPLTYQYPNTTRPDSAPTELSQVLLQRGGGAEVRYPIGDREPMAGLPIVNPATVGHWRSSYARTRPDRARCGGDAGHDLEPAGAGRQLGETARGAPWFASRVRMGARRFRCHAANTLRMTSRRSRATPAIRPPSVSTSSSRGTILFCEPRPSGISGTRLRWKRALLEAWVSTSRQATRSRPGSTSRRALIALPSSMSTVPMEPSLGIRPSRGIEVGAGYYFHRQLLAKVSYQYNERDAGPLTTRGIPAVQLLFWF